MKKILLTLCISFISLVGQAADGLNATCPVSGKPVNSSITTEYKKTAAVCCDRCVNMFNSDPKTYLPALLAATPNQCPMSKRKSKPEKTVTYTQKVAFADEASKKTFEASPDKYIKDVK
jgi:YHS domain-containing protein